MTNVPAYYSKELITAVKCFITHSLGLVLLNNIFRKKEVRKERKKNRLIINQNECLKRAEIEKI